MGNKQLVFVAVDFVDSGEFSSQNINFQVAEFVVAGGDYMGVWKETLKSWNWKSFSKMIVPIALRRNGSYDDMIASVIKAGLQLNQRIHNDDNDLIGNERLSDHSKESLGDNSNESLGDHSMNIHDDPINVENQPVDVEDSEPKCCEEMQAKQELGSQSNHSFSDGTNLCINQTFSNKNELQLLLAEVAAKKSFDFATVKSCTKYLKVKCVSHNCAWMLRARKYECSNRFHIYKYIGEHSYSVEHANNSHRKISIKVIASLCVDMYRDGKSSNVKEIQRAMFNSFRCSPSYWKCWKGGVVAKEMVRGRAKNRYSCLTTFSYMFETLNVGSSYSIMVKRDSHRFMYYFLAFGACIQGFAHMKKLKEIVVDESYLCFIFDRHKSITNGIVNVYNHAHHGYCMRHLGDNLRVNHHCGYSLYLYYNAAKTFSLEEFDNHFVEFKNKYPATAVVLEHYIDFEKWSRAHFPGNRYDVMTTNIVDSLNTMLIEYLMAFIFNSIAKRFGELLRERHAYILKSMGNQMVPAAEKITRKNFEEINIFEL
ncbi:hypothetical protein KY290_013558 [Solanum tuberosum]|uniref:Transposase MuDR plant domain-containing protein n=1 Tax=Solanum tuberosum TaxID=4113 RepID=A0ABQ7VPV0_SOLTU|nr:hypothetical protein KY289_013676 [Solanum tuberosum]KAH0719578.1 hypothetical protein KY285_015609 [Solanum tuberosum]KAH0769577.1 hypothetical protein KY290_013558 [Solanum tuberosum]